MTVTDNSFRQRFPEFGDVNVYLPSAIDFWRLVAVGDTSVTPPLNGLLNERRLGSQYDLLTQLFIAHNLVLEQQAQNSAAVGAVPGLSTGPMSAKSVDKVSASYDTTSGLNPKDTHWNLTIYGTRFIRLVKLFGMGGMQIGVGCAPYPTQAWVGPPVDGGGGGN